MTQSYAGFSIFYGWLSNTFPSPPAKRAVALALINSLSQLGNVFGSYVPPLSLSTPRKRLLTYLCPEQVRLAARVGTDVPPVVRDMHCRERNIHCVLLHLAAAAPAHECAAA
jgi:hypothetical protein